MKYRLSWTLRGLRESIIVEAASERDASVRFLNKNTLVTSVTVEQVADDKPVTPDIGYFSQDPTMPRTWGVTAEHDHHDGLD